MTTAAIRLAEQLKGMGIGEAERLAMVERLETSLIQSMKATAAMKPHTAEVHRALIAAVVQLRVAERRLAKLEDKLRMYAGDVPAAAELWN